MNKPNFTHVGGQPIDTDTLKFMDDSYNEVISGIAQAFGDKTIVTGVEVASGFVSDGFIVIGAEILRFAGGTLSGTAIVIIVENDTSVVFDDTTTHVVETERYATLGVTGGFPFTQLKRPPLYTSGDIKEKIVTNAYIADNFDAITGVGTNAEAGWQILSFAAPGTAGKMFINYDPSNVLFDTVGNTGGAATATLAKANVPVLNVNLPKTKADVDRGGLGSLFSIDETETVNVGGSGDAFHILNPYYVILKLVRL
jgi:hypothetical protein